MYKYFSTFLHVITNNGDRFRQAHLQLAELLKEIAPTEYKSRQWGKQDADDRLERLRMKDNTYRWLCKKHADEYRKMF